jgi:hypothetical protein
LVRYCILDLMEQPPRMAAELMIPDTDDGRAGALVAAWLATKRSPHTRAIYLRDLTQWVGWLAGHSVPLLEAYETTAAIWTALPATFSPGTSAAPAELPWEKARRRLPAWGEHITVIYSGTNADRHALASAPEGPDPC